MQRLAIYGNLILGHPLHPPVGFVYSTYRTLTRCSSRWREFEKPSLTVRSLPKRPPVMCLSSTHEDILHRTDAKTEALHRAYLEIRDVSSNESVAERERERTRKVSNRMRGSLSPKILVVDDEPDVVDYVRDALEDEGYEVIAALNSQDVFTALACQPDLILLDVMMPGMDGLALCRAVRDRVACPILFLSALGEEDDRIRGLMVGGDDYIVKPISVRELVARVRAHLRAEQRRHGRQGRTILHYGELAVDISRYEVYLRDRRVPLTAREFEIVQLLLSSPNRVYSRDEIYEKVWGYEAEGSSRTVTEHIRNIRAKFAAIDRDHTFISTVWGVGYRWASSD